MKYRYLMLLPALCGVLAGTAFANQRAGTAGQAAGSSTVAEAGASELWAEYAVSPDTHPNIANYSYAGYGYGEVPIPDNAGPVYNVKEFGALGDGKADDSAAVRAALAAVGQEGGVVYFPNGEYRLSTVLFVHTNNTVLRGESEEGTKLVFTGPLNDVYRNVDYPANIRTGYATFWNYSGGLIWFAPLARGNTYLTEGQEPPRYSIGWHHTRDNIAIAQEASRGSRILRMAKSDVEWKAGEHVLLVQSDPDGHELVKHLSGGGAWADEYKWLDGSGSSKWEKPRPLVWIVEIESVSEDGRTLTLRQPLRFDVKPQWNAKVRPLFAPIRDSGIENVTIICERAYEWTVKDHHHIDTGWNAVFFNNAVHCWLRNVTMVDVENGILLRGAKNNTLEGFTLKASSPERLQHHHGTVTAQSSSDNLFKDFVIESKPMHGINSEGFSCGNVWMRGRLEHGIVDTHRQMPFENLRTDITLVRNDGTHGGTGGPVMGARCVEWNVRVESGRPYLVAWANAHPSGALVGMQGVDAVWDAQSGPIPVGDVANCRIEFVGEAPVPANLYEAQLALRLASESKGQN